MNNHGYDSRSQAQSSHLATGKDDSQQLKWEVFIKSPNSTLKLTLLALLGNSKCTSFLLLGAEACYLHSESINKHLLLLINIYGGIRLVA